MCCPPPSQLKERLKDIEDPVLEILVKCSHRGIDQRVLQADRAAQLEAVLALKVDQSKDARKCTWLTDAKAITGEALLKLHLDNRLNHLRCINMFHSTVYPSPVLPLQQLKFLGLYLLPLLHYMSVFQRIRMSWKGWLVA